MSERREREGKRKDIGFFSFVPKSNPKDYEDLDKKYNRLTWCKCINKNKIKGTLF